MCGSPDRSLLCVLIAGTKGKGSTAAFLASICHEAGVRAGLYTSPHLQSWRERIRVDGAAVSPRVFAREIRSATALVRRLRRERTELGLPSAFELLTIAALAHFARRRCDVAILEVGLGGRYDATNASDPTVSIVTSIGLDHQAILGRTLARIAREKAGVLRQQRPAFLARQHPAARRALERACQKTGAHCRTVGPLSHAARLGLAGEHQRQNAALAREAAQALAALGLAIRPRQISAGLARAFWPGRLESVGRSPTILLDGAHSPESVAAIASDLVRRRGPLHVVFGCTADRDARALVRPLIASGARIYATASTGPRALSPEAVAAAAGHAAAGTYPAVGPAIAAARAAAARTGTICVTGSLALVGEARTALGLTVVERLFDRGSSRSR